CELKKLTAAAALLAAATLALGGCSRAGGAQLHNAGTCAAAGTANTARIKIAMITHETPGDSFGDIVQKGAEASPAEANVALACPLREPGARPGGARSPVRGPEVRL